MTAIAERSIGTPQKETLAPIASLTLSPVEHTKETLDYWVNWINDPDVRKWMWDNLPTSAEDINSWLFNATHDSYRHYFTINADGKPIGFINLRQDQAPDTTGEIGIVIGEKEYQSRGIGKLALKAMDSYAKDVVGLVSTRAYIKPDNEKSIRLFTGAGYVPTGHATLDGVTMKKFEKVL